MAADKNLKRRKYSAELKAQVVNECEVPGASVARVAMARGINANVVHSWPQIARTKRSTGAALTPTPAKFVPVVISSAVPIVAPASQAVAPLTPSPLTPSPLTQPPIEVELRRGTTTLKLLWPATATAQLSAWTREVLA